MTKFFFKFNKQINKRFLTYFLPISPIFVQKNTSKKIWLCHAQLHRGFQHHVKILRNLIPRKKYISQDPSGYSWQSNKCNCSKLAFTSQRYKVSCWSNQKIIASQSTCKKSAQFILKIQQSFESNELNRCAHFWQTPPKNHWNNFQLSWTCTSMQKISSFHRFILEIQSISKSRHQTGHKKNLINF